MHVLHAEKSVKTKLRGLQRSHQSHGQSVKEDHLALQWLSRLVETLRGILRVLAPLSSLVLARRTGAPVSRGTGDQAIVYMFLHVARVWLLFCRWIKSNSTSLFGTFKAGITKTNGWVCDEVGRWSRTEMATNARDGGREEQESERDGDRPYLLDWVYLYHRIIP